MASENVIRAFQSDTVRSVLALARVCPSGLNATEFTTSVGPVSGWLSGVGLGRSRSHPRPFDSVLAFSPD